MPPLRPIGSEPDDNALVARILGGDGAAVEHLLLNQCGEQLKYLARFRFVSLGLEVEEVVSELFLHLRARDWAALRAFRGFGDKGSSCRLKTYVVLIAARMLAKKAVCKNEDAKRLISIEGMENVVESPNAEREHAADELVQLLMRMDDPTDRAVLYHYKIEGRDATEVSRMMNLSVENVYTRTSRALDRLREVLRKEGVDV